MKSCAVVLMVLYCVCLKAFPIVGVHTVAPENTTGHMTRISNPSLRNSPSLLLFVTPRYGTYNPHTIGVWYDDNIGQWTIYNEDRAPLPQGMMFNYAAMEKSSTGVFVHTSTPLNIAGYYTYLNHPSTDFNKDARLMITPTWNEAYIPGPLGVWFDGERWSIYRQDKQAIPPGTRFNVMVLPEGPTVFADYTNLKVVTYTHKTLISNSRGHITNLSEKDEGITLLVTHNWGTEGPFNPGVPGVWYDGQSWAVMNQGREKIEFGATFNCFVFQEAVPRQPLSGETDPRVGFVEVHNQTDFPISLRIRFLIDGEERVAAPAPLTPGKAQKYRIPMRARGLTLNGTATLAGITREVITESFIEVPNQAFSVSNTFAKPVWRPLAEE